MGDRIAQLILERIDTPKVEEVRALEETVRGSGGFGSTGVNGKNDNEIKTEWECKNERIEKKNNEDNETLKGRFSSGRQRTEKNRKSLNERSGCPERDRSYPSSS